MSYASAQPAAARSRYAAELPHSVEAEQHVLACCLIDGASADTLSHCVASGLAPAAFYDAGNRLLYERMVELYQARGQVDVAVLAEELQKKGELSRLGGLRYLSELSMSIPTTAQAAYFVERVAELSLLRELVRCADSAREQCLAHAEGTVAELVDRIEHDLFEVSQQRIRGAGPQRFAAHVDESMAVFAQMQSRKFSVTGVRSGFRDLDALTYGFQPAEMVVLAARPSMGKTALALNFAEAAALPPACAECSAVPTLIFSLEMSAQQLAQRMLCARARVNMHLLREGFIAKDSPEQVALQSAAEELKKAPLFIDDSSQLSVMELRAKARRLHQKTPLGLIIVDYLQLMSPSDARAPREQQVAECSRGLKALAKELHVPVIVLSQLNRAAERDGRPARLSDLRESGAIEQDADLVLLLGRPPEEQKAGRNGEGSAALAALRTSPAPYAELTLAKHRNGPVGELRLTFLKHLTRFESYHA